MSGLERYGVLYQDKPRFEVSQRLAEIIYESRDEIDRLAGEQGMLYQDAQAEKAEWLRLCAILIEKAINIEEDCAERH